MKKKLTILGTILLIYAAGFLSGFWLRQNRLERAFSVLKANEAEFLERQVLETLKKNLKLDSGMEEKVAEIVRNGAGEWLALRKRFQVNVRDLIIKHAPAVEAILDDSRKAVFREGVSGLLREYPEGARNGQLPANPGFGE
jgi:hypothetical protein